MNVEKVARILIFNTFVIKVELIRFRLDELAVKCLNFFPRMQ